MPLGAFRQSLNLANLAAASRTAKTITANGTAVVDTSQSKFGTASVGFGTVTSSVGGGALLVDRTDFSFTNQTFTLECWFRWNGTANPGGATFGQLMGIWSSNYPNGDRRYGLYAGSTNKNLQFFWYTGNNGTLDSINYNNAWPNANQWYHVALVADASNFTLYVDGTNRAQKTRVTMDTITAGTFSIGRQYAAGGTDLNFPWNGWIDEIRVSNSARYTGNFTPSASAFTNDANTLLLIHCNGTNGSTTFTDDNA